MYPENVRALVVEAVEAGFTLSEAAEIAGCSKSAAARWARAAGARAARCREPVYLPLEEKMELAARYMAGERAADLAAEVDWQHLFGRF